MKNLASFKRLIILAMASVSILYEWLWYRFFWYGELFPRWVKEMLPFWENGHMLVLAIYAALLFMFSSMYGGMKLSYYRNTEVIFSMIFSTLITNVAWRGRPASLRPPSGPPEGRLPAPGGCPPPRRCEGAARR